jgi:uncharacterized membrane protein
MINMSVTFATRISIFELCVVVYTSNSWIQGLRQVDNELERNQDVRETTSQNKQTKRFFLCVCAFLTFLFLCLEVYLQTFNPCL